MKHFTRLRVVPLAILALTLTACNFASVAVHQPVRVKVVSRTVIPAYDQDQGSGSLGQSLGTIHIPTQHQIQIYAPPHSVAPFAGSSVCINVPSTSYTQFHPGHWVTLSAGQINSAGGC